MTWLVLRVTRLVLRVTRLVLRVTRLVLRVTWLVLRVTLLVLTNFLSNSLTGKTDFLKVSADHLYFSWAGAGPAPSKTGRRR